MGMEQLPTALQRRQLWGGFAVLCLSCSNAFCPFSSPSTVDNDTEPALWAERDNKSNHREIQCTGMQWEMRGQGFHFAAVSH